MNTIATRSRPALQPQLSATSRIVTAVAVAGVVALAWFGAQRASHQAVHSATQAFSHGTTYVTLPMVDIVGRRATPPADARAAL